MHRFNPALLYWQGYRVGECRVNHRFRKFGKTKYRWGRLGHGLLDVVLVAFWQRYSLRPIHLFGAIGFMILMFGAGTTAFLVIERLFLVSHLQTVPFLSSASSPSWSVQFFALGLLADIMLRYNTLYITSKATAWRSSWSEDLAPHTALDILWLAGGWVPVIHQVGGGIREAARRGGAGDYGHRRLSCWGSSKIEDIDVELRFPRLVAERRIYPMNTLESWYL